MKTAASEIYLDNNATTRPLPEVTDAVAQAMSDGYGNPSSPHGRGASARAALECARQQVASLVGCEVDSIVFTSGGTEANNMVIRSLCSRGRGSRLITTAVEHSSVLMPAQALAAMGVEVVFLPVDKLGRVNIEDLERALATPADLVSIQWANSETGTIQPIEDFCSVCRKRGVPIHVDAAQAVGRLAIDTSRIQTDYLTFTAHKIHGPQGVGAVVANSVHCLDAILYGGDQEKGKRPGTENLPGIIGFGRAASLRNATLSQIVAGMKAMRDRFEQLVLDRIPDAHLNGDPRNRVANSTNMLFPGVDGMAMMAQLDGAGLRCSLTSACISASLEPSHVLRAMGLSEHDAFSSLRFSFSVLNNSEDAKAAAEHVFASHKRLSELELKFASQA